MWATMVALACGVIGVVAVVVAVLTGHKFDYAPSQVVPILHWQNCSMICCPAGAECRSAAAQTGSSTRTCG
jgi:hypothetical protein